MRAAAVRSSPVLPKLPSATCTIGCPPLVSCCSSAAFTSANSRETISQRLLRALKPAAELSRPALVDALHGLGYAVRHLGALAPTLSSSPFRS